MYRGLAIEENHAKVQDLIMHNKALRLYVGKTIKPVIYDLQKRELLSKDYFDPKILSSTYITRHVMQEYNKQRQKNNMEMLKYKIVSDNPRNLKNKTNEKESKLLKLFNEGKKCDCQKVITKGSKEYIYYAVPTAKNKDSCMKCHSTADKAPKDLVKMYGNKNGFGEKVDNIRGIMSIEMPLKQEKLKMQKLYFIFAGMISLIFILVSIIIYFFIKKLNLKDKKLLNQINIDSLTNIYNRHKFNKDMDNFIFSKRDENIYLMMLDIDFFKNINDTYGHATGDLVLEKLCTTVTNTIRENDIFYRIGGEEFAIISSFNNNENEMIFAKKINQIIRNQKFSKIEQVTVSIGFTKLIKGESFLSFYERCDKALYNAKENGRDCIETL